MVEGELERGAVFCCAADFHLSTFRSEIDAGGQASFLLTHRSEAADDLDIGGFRALALALTSSEASVRKDVLAGTGKDLLSFPKASVIFPLYLSLYMKAKQAEQPVNQAEFLSRVIHEYLLKTGMLRTLETFTMEQESGHMQVDDNSSLNVILQCLDQGNRAGFVQYWTKFLPAAVRNSAEGRKVEFYVQLFFGIYPLHTIKRGQRPVQEADLLEFQREMDEFMQYLAERGGELSRSEEFLHYYALPHVPVPTDHPSFRNLFTRGWLNELKDRVMKFYKAYTNSSTPLLLEMLKAYEGRNKVPGHRSPQKQPGMHKAQPKKVDSSQIDQYEQQLGLMRQEYQMMQRKEELLRSTLVETDTKWTAFARDLVLLLREALKAVDLLRKGKGISDNFVVAVHEKVRHYEGILQIPAADASWNPSLSVSYVENPAIESAGPSPKPKRDQFSIRTDRPMMKGHASLPPINYASIIRDLRTLNDELQLCLLLQALRWRLSRSQAQCRKEILGVYVRFNILCTTKPHDQLLDKLLSSSRRVKEFTMRFLNTLTSERGGRTYVLLKENLIKLLLGILYSEKEDTSLRQNTLGTLQKLSLRRKPQSEMIELNMIEWLIKLLKVHIHGETVSAYSLEYATALLMNLSLRTLGKDNIEQGAQDVLPVLHQLLEHADPQVRTYVNGTLYSILTRRQLKEGAYAQRIDETLTGLLQQGDEYYNRQIQYCLDQLQATAQDDAKSDEAEDDADDVEEEGEESEDEMIPEDEDMEDLIQEPGVTSGEDYLMEHYQPRPPVVKKLEEVEGKPPSRPITPGQARNLPSELQSRPKIPRTPLNSDIRTAAPEVSQAAPVVNFEKMNPIPERKEQEELEVGQKAAENQAATPIGTGEFTHAFKTRPKIPRSPQ